MGIDYSGGMIVGCHASAIGLFKIEENYYDINPESEDYDFCFYEWCEENDLKIMSEYYDAPVERSFIGFEIDESYIKVTKEKLSKI